MKSTVFADLAEEILAALEHAHRIRFPTPRFRDDFDNFVRVILGVEPAGLDAGDLAAARVLWCACSFGDAGERIEALRVRAGRCVVCIADDRIAKPCPHSAQIDAALVASLTEMRR